MEGGAPRPCGGGETHGGPAMAGEASTDTPAAASNAGATLQAPSPQPADSVQALPGELCELPGTVLGAPPDGWWKEHVRGVANEASKGGRCTPRVRYKIAGHGSGPEPYRTLIRHAGAVRVCVNPIGSDEVLAGYWVGRIGFDSVRGVCGSKVIETSFPTNVSQCVQAAWDGGRPGVPGMSVEIAVITFLECLPPRRGGRL